MAKFEHSFRQSWLNTAATCPERARRELTKTIPNSETDAAAVGTAVHAGIEEFLRSGCSYRDAVDIASERFAEIEQHPDFVWTKYSHRVAHGLIETFLGHWWGIREQFQPLEIEHQFDVLLHEDDERIIRLTGTIDLIDKRLGLIDWKTSGRGAYDTWEYDRWAVQPTVYSWALYGGSDQKHPFTYCVMHKEGVQQFTVWRDASDWNWLRQRAIGYARLIEAGLPEWPLHDNHALCSAKWCPAWLLCKGAHFQ